VRRAAQSQGNRPIGVPTKRNVYVIDGADEQHRNDVLWYGMVVVGNNFDVILADPPWSYYGSGTKNAAAAKHYDLMSDDDLLNLSVVPDLLAPSGIFFCWVTSPRLDFAVDLVRHWELTPRGIAFVWVKTRKTDNVPIGAQGIRPSITKPTSEFVMAASRVKKGRPMPLASEAVPQVLLAPRGAHSAKPEDIQDRIEQMYPNATKLEMFARRVRPGWQAWGNEIDETHWPKQLQEQRTTSPSGNARDKLR